MCEYFDTQKWLAKRTLYPITLIKSQFSIQIQFILKRSLKSMRKSSPTKASSHISFQIHQRLAGDNQVWTCFSLQNTNDDDVPSKPSSQWCYKGGVKVYDFPIHPSSLSTQFKPLISASFHRRARSKSSRYFNGSFGTPLADLFWKKRQRDNKSWLHVESVKLSRPARPIKREEKLSGASSLVES